MPKRRSPARVWFRDSIASREGNLDRRDSSPGTWRSARRLTLGLLVAVALPTAVAACASDSDIDLSAPVAGAAGSGGGAGTGGAPGKGGASGKGGMSGKGGTAGKGGSEAGSGGTGGTEAGAGGSAGNAGSGGDAGTSAAGGTAGSAGSGGDAGNAGTGGSAAGTGGSAAGTGGTAGSAGSAGAGGNGVQVGNVFTFGPGPRVIGGDIDTCAEAHGEIGCCEGKVLYTGDTAETCPTRCGWSLELGQYSCHVGSKDPDVDPSGVFPRACGLPTPAGVCACAEDADCASDEHCNVPRGYCSTFGLCTSDSECSSYAPHCSPDSQSCVECTQNDHCLSNGAGPICRPDRNCGCNADSDCPSTKPVCAGGECAACRTNDQCKNPKKPICDDLFHDCNECDLDTDCKDPAKPICLAGDCWKGDSCKTGPDDAAEPNDDGPAGATPLTLNQPISATLCDSILEYDFYSAQIGSGGRRLQIKLSSYGATAPTLRVFDASGFVLGESTRYNSGDVEVDLRHLPAGKVFIEVATNAKGGPYTITWTSHDLDACPSDVHCGDGWQYGGLRGACNKALGACLARQGKGTFGPGAACDSNDDCSSGACNYIPYTPRSAQSVCSLPCLTQADCEGLPGTQCASTGYSTDKACVPLCVENQDCAVKSGGGVVDFGYVHESCVNGLCTP
jgi:hypothetical protein